MPDAQQTPRSRPLSLILIGPDVPRRRELVAALMGSHSVVVREFGDYLSREDQAEIALRETDAVIVDLDDEIERGLKVIERLSSRNAAMTIMAYATSSDQTMMRRAMHAGAREFLSEPLLPDAISEALLRASARRDGNSPNPGKVLTFFPSKGGVGATTLAVNFALALREKSGASVVVVDLDYQLGEVASGLGLQPRFSIIDALMNSERIDREFLSTILLKHSSGLAVLGSPEEFNYFTAPTGGAQRLFQLLREEYAYVVVDAGSCANEIQTMLIDSADILYLVTELSFPALRNARRILSFLQTKDQLRGVNVVVNRFDARRWKIDESTAEKTLGRPIVWRVPDTRDAARHSQEIGVPLYCEGDSPLSRVLVQMAASACGKAAVPPKQATGFNFFRFRASTARGDD